ncbi:hypothetical protein [Paenibacillus mendelii]|uniref:Lipoprotein n=1 Tax=Paenibacillus mendelii TaxID=206163 RepID=A0ABV6J2Y3_9BACL|nr:hypothetical protein [Paenibacillus mendelii]MCQ6559330.1 hypothetical protein [Paenibacillus mendelii]
MRKGWILLLLITVVAALIGGCSKDNTKKDPSSGTNNEQQAQDSISNTTESTPDDEPQANNGLESGANQLLDMTVIQSGTFGFADQTGKRILASVEESDRGQLESMHTAIGNSGQVVTVRYVSSQEAGENDNGRQTAQNFDNQAGELFEVQDGTAKPNETYFLISGAELNQKALLPVTDSREDQVPVDDSVKEEMKKSKNRDVQNVWQVAVIGEGQPIYLVQFERQGDEMLASLAIKTEKGLVFQDYPAKYDENSTWRVDDGGLVSPEMFSFLFAAKTADGLLIGVKWMGAEGENVSFLSQSGNTFHELDKQYGRYMSPI